MSRSEDWNRLRRKWISRKEDWDLVHQTLSANRSGTMFDVCEGLVPVLCRCCSYYTGQFFMSAWKVFRYGMKIAFTSSDGSRGGARGARPPPPLFLEQTESRKGRKKFFRSSPPPPPLSKWRGRKRTANTPVTSLFVKVKHNWFWHIC